MGVCENHISNFTLLRVPQVYQGGKRDDVPSDSGADRGPRLFDRKARVSVRARATRRCADAE